MERELLRLAAFGRNDVHVQVSVAVARERDPFAVGREARINIPRGISRYSLDVGAVVVGGPNVAQVRERDTALVVARVADQFGFPRETDAGRTGKKHKNTRSE